MLHIEGTFSLRLSGTHCTHRVVLLFQSHLILIIFLSQIACIHHNYYQIRENEELNIVRAGRTWIDGCLLPSAW